MGLRVPLAGQSTGQMESKAVRHDLRGIVYREGQWWIAHCLEMDVVAEGDSPLEAISSVVELCGIKIAEAMRDGNLRSIFRPAPPEIWELNARAKRFRKPPGATINLPKHVSRFDARSLQFA